ncbi:pentatricopeptide repeat-containing protein At2g29760, chloroplastic-like [Curcuma longa]|uniref:pentatricopeptide repeat-containing protein At2g29760, chloroplastic-like n=1 Tax=Curcuma longa TaxID=136217 RepID=UPI003D9EC452
METSRKLHAHLTVTGSHRHSPLLSKVLLSYALSPPHLPLALRLFDRIQAPNTFLWNTMIRGFAQSDAPGAAVAFYGRMRRQGVPIDHMTFPFALKACARVPAAGEGSRIHADCLKFGFSSDIFVSNSLIHMYSACGDMSLASKVFDEMPERNLISWNSLICACSLHGRLRAALRLFESMRMQDIKADKVTMVKVVSACTHLGAWDLAESMVKYIRENNIEVDVYLGNTLIDYYGRRGSVEHARKIFEEMTSHNIVTLNAMITTYAKASDLVSARRIFDTMPVRDLISWSSMITGYSQANHFSKALSLFRQMQKATNIQPDEVVIASVLSACAHLGALGLGRWLHDYMRKNNIRVDIYAANSLIDMYSKCGSIMDAFEVFRGMDKRDTMSWNIIMLGLATNGYAGRVLQVFSDMLSEGFRPNDGSFLGILVACAHSGAVEEGLKYFDSMKKDFGVEPQMKHYGCVVDLLSRSGELNKAYNFIKEMPFTPDPIIWRTLLAACCTHGNVDLAEIATEKLNELDPNNSGNYVLLSNTYAMANQWSDATDVRGKMERSEVQKVPGCSSIEVMNLAHKPTASEHLPNW